MNYLTLTQRLRRRCRVSGSGPTAITGQSEEYNRLLDFINESWRSIQSLHPDWLWMRQSMTFPTVVNQATYTQAQITATGTNFSNFGNWDTDSFRSYLTSVGQADERILGYLPYDDWRDRWQIGSLRTSDSQPIDMTVTPALGIGLGPTPIVGYTIEGDYYTVATEFTDAADEPALPEQFHMLIVYRAMVLYAGGEAASEIFQMGNNLYKEMLNRLELQQLPQMLLGGPLV